MYSQPLDTELDRARVLISDALDMTTEQTDSFLQCVAWARLKRGEVLFDEGAVSDSIYFVVAGRLKGTRIGMSSIKREGIDFNPGELFGELGFFDGSARTLTLAAVKDSLVIQLNKEGAARLGELTQPLLMRLIKTLISRLKREAGYVQKTKPELHIAIKVLAAAGQTERLRALFEKSLSSAANGVTLWWVDSLDLGEREAMLNLVDKALIIADMSEYTIARLHHQLDQLFHGFPPHTERWVGLIHPENKDARQTEDIERGINLDGLGHIRTEYFQTDTIRLARRVANQSIALVLGGGGARGFAHAGVFQAFEEAGLVIDQVGGTSMGALVAGLISLGKGAAHAQAMIRTSFAKGLPFTMRDYAIPKYGFIKAGSADRVYRDAFGERRIEDQPIPFFAVCCNLTTGGQTVLDHGLMWEAVRATTSIPVIFEPSVTHQAVLVDGALLNNLPADTMRQRGGRHLIAVDVGMQSDTSSLRKTPGIAKTLMRITELGGLDKARAAEPMSDIFIRPDIQDIGLMEFFRRDEIIERGYTAGVKAIQAIRDKGLL